MKCASCHSTAVNLVKLYSKHFYKCSNCGAFVTRPASRCMKPWTRCGRQITKTGATPYREWMKKTQTELTSTPRAQNSIMESRT